mgnify:CR=1 FL=1
MESDSPLYSLESLFQEAPSQSSAPTWSEIAKPCHPAYVLKNFKHELSPYELQEILNYPEIYFISTPENKVKASRVYEYLDDNYHYIIKKGDHICYRYELDIFLGNGSYGNVVKAFDHKEKKYVAIKILKKDEDGDDEFMDGLALDEVKILKDIKQHNGRDSHVIEYLDYFMFRGHHCITFPLYEDSLYRYRKLHGTFSLSELKKIAIQILKGLKFLRERKIVHGDLKPGNILLNPRTLDIALIDFGLSCYETDPNLWMGLQTLFFRAPEVFLGIKYTGQIDMWSLGCILAYLYRGRYIFGGKNDYDQFWQICCILGLPPQTMIAQTSKESKKALFKRDLTPKENVIQRYTVEMFLQCEDEAFVDFVKKCFVYNPNERLTPEQGLLHPWIVNNN